MTRAIPVRRWPICLAGLFRTAGIILEQLHYCRLFQLQLNGAFDVEKKQVFPKQIESNTNALEQAFAGRNPFTTICTRHQLLAVILLPSLHKIPMRAAAAQTAMDEAAIACALERYRLANGQFPETLEALVPQFISQLPNDVISGEPYKYHRTNDGQFVLYSVGWNEKDDGGVPGQTLFDDKARRLGLAVSGEVRIFGNIQQPTSNFEHPISVSAVNHRALGVRVVGCSLLAAPCRFTSA